MTFRCSARIINQAPKPTGDVSWSLPTVHSWMIQSCWVGWYGVYGYCFTLEVP
jgi:hypothetical protein